MASAQPLEDRQVTEPVLRVERVSKSFAGVCALDDVSLDIRPREVIGLIGENGAGKSTLLKVLAGVLRADRGRIIVRGKPICPANVAAAAASGIGIVFQEPAVMPNVTVAENILLGHERTVLRAGFYDWRTLYALAATHLDKLGSGISPSALTATLSFGERQLVEIARALAIEERTRHEPIILFDEPTSMLDANGIETVLGQIERLRRRASVVFVSHRLEEVLRVSDRICVMVNGRCVAAPDRATCNIADLQRLMLGHKLDAEYLAPLSTPGPKVRLSVRGLGRRNRYHGVNFDLHAGEVLGIAELADSGGESLCRTLFGAERADTGEIVVDGRAVRLREPADAVRLGIGYVPAERHLEGIVGGLGVRENMTLAHLDEFRRGPFIDLAGERQLVKSWIERLRIRVPAADAPARDLSGGNQQKVVLAKWLIGRKLKVLILDRPMRGLDIGVKAEMFTMIRDLARVGLGVLLLADTVDEVMALSHTIIVMKGGFVSARFPVSVVKPSRLQILERMV
jgi:ribose transport system ATP-binding protein